LIEQMAHRFLLFPATATLGLAGLANRFIWSAHSAPTMG
jgi:hypothetical protein